MNQLGRAWSIEDSFNAGSFSEQSTVLMKQVCPVRYLWYYRSRVRGGKRFTDIS